MDGAGRGDVLGRGRHLARDHAPGQRLHVFGIRCPAQFRRFQVEGQLGRGSDDVEERVTDLLGNVQHGVLDLVTERTQQLGRVFGGGDTLGVDFTLVERLHDHPDPQLAGIAPDFFRPGTFRRRGIVGRANIGTGGQIEQHG